MLSIHDIPDISGTLNIPISITMSRTTSITIDYNYTYIYNIRSVDQTVTMFLLLPESNSVTHSVATDLKLLAVV